MGAVNADCSLCSTNKTNYTDKITEVAEPTNPKPEKEKSNSMGIVALLLIFGLIYGSAFYYFKVVKNKVKPQSNPNMNEYAFDDEDDEVEYGFETAEKEQEDTAVESEDDGMKYFTDSEYEQMMMQNSKHSSAFTQNRPPKNEQKIRKLTIVNEKKATKK